MAVYERRYRPYEDVLTPQNSRFLIIPRYAIREVMAKRLFLAFFVACFLWPLVLSLIIYLPHNLSFLETIAAQAGAAPEQIFGFKFDRRFFSGYVMGLPQLFIGFFLTFVVGPVLVTDDLRNNALPLYLSRPFSRIEYIAGKITVLTVLLSAITWVPGLWLFGLQSYLGGGEWLRANWSIAPAIVLNGALLIAVMCLVSLAISAHVKWKPVARLSLLVIVLIGWAFAQVLNLLLGTHWADLMNVMGLIRVVWRGLLGTADPSQLPATVAGAALTFYGVACLALLARKLRAYEVVR